LLTVPDQSTNIQLVVENLGAAPPVAVDRGGPPALAGGSGDGLLVKGTGDRSWRAAVGELFEDPADDRGFNLIDAAFAADGLAGRVETVNPSYSPKIAYLRALDAIFAGQARRRDRVGGWRRGGPRLDFALL
jgi:hypothetical protein